MNDRSPRLNFRPDLEGLRGVAILLVVAYHVGIPGFSGGYVGVDVFFVLSGFLITGLLLKEKQATGRISLLNFYARRARRLLPAATAVLVATIVAVWFFYAPLEQQDLTSAATATAAYVSNVWFATHATQYLTADVSANPFLQTWSLSVEEQFYILWPPLIALILYRAPIAARLRLLVTIVGALALLSLMGSVWLTSIAAPMAFFNSLTRAWEFAAGGLIALGLQNAPPVRDLRARAVPWLGISAVLGSAVFFSRATLFPGTAVLIPVAGTSAILCLPPDAPTVLARILSVRWLRWTGRLSYSWYLWHWPVLIVGATIVETPGRTFRLLAAVASLLLAWGTYVWLERSVRTSRELAKRPQLSLVGAAGLTLVTVGISILASHAARRAANAPAQWVFTHARQDLPAVYSSGCHLGYLETDLAPCVFGDTTSKTTIVLFGDSHAAQWFPGLERLALERHWRLVSWSKGACPAASVDRDEPVLGRPYLECTLWREAVVTRLVDLQPRAVVMASNSSFYIGTALKHLSGGVEPNKWFLGTREMLSRLSRADVPTLLIRDTPEPGFDVPSCLARAAWTPRVFSRSCNFATAKSADDAAFAAETNAAAGLTGVAFVDPSRALCDTTTCYAIRDGTVVYRDTHHLTAEIATSLAPVLGNELDALLASADEAHAKPGKPKLPM